MNEINDGIIAADENDLGKYTMQSEGRNKPEESEESDQSMERPRRQNAGIGMDRLEMFFIEKYMYMDNIANY